MKTLQILRHAKTEKIKLNQRDFDRKLTERGLGQMADLIAQKNTVLSKAESVLVSSARRTRMTWDTLSHLFTKIPVSFDDNLYLAPLVQLAKTIEQQDDTLDNILLIGHNDGLSDLVSYLVDEPIYLPTSGYIELELNVEHWSHFSRGIASVKDQFFSEFR